LLPVRGATGPTAPIHVAAAQLTPEWLPKSKFTEKIDSNKRITMNFHPQEIQNR
jgi:hypothetical protein